MASDRHPAKFRFFISLLLTLLMVFSISGNPVKADNKKAKIQLCRLESAGVVLYGIPLPNGIYGSLTLEGKGICSKISGTTIVNRSMELPRIDITSRNAKEEDVIELTLAPPTKCSEPQTMTCWLNRKTLRPQTVLLAYTSKPDFKLTARGLKNGDYQGVVLRGKGIHRSPAFTIPQLPRYSVPEMAARDWDGDGRVEVAVFYAVATGTGVNIMEAHILNPETMKEIPIADPQKVVKENVKSSVDEKNIIIKIQDRTIRIPSGKYIAPDGHFDKTIGGAIVGYEVNSRGEIMARSGASVCNVSTYIGDFLITYRFKNGRFIMKDIDFVLYKD